MPTKLPAWMHGWILAGLLAGGTAAAEPPKTPCDRWAEAFASPPAESKPWCYWWWLNGAASKEGITRDFEEMRHKGISGALLFDAGQAGPDAPRGPAFMSVEWRELYKHAVREADRLGIVLGVNLCSGWNVGGPWVTAEHAAKKIVSAQTVVKGSGPIRVTLPLPSLVQEFYRDIATLAIPATDGDLPEGTLVASSQFLQFGPALARDGAEDTRWVSRLRKPEQRPTPERPEFLQFDFAEPRPVAAVFLQPHRVCGPKDVEIQWSDDGTTFRPLRQATLAPREPVTLAFAETRARHFRVLIRSAHPGADGSSWSVQVAEIALLTQAQAARRWERGAAIDLTSKLDATGQLAWNAPAGTWRVLRIGYTLFGRNIKCVGSGPAGLEIDTMSAAAMESHFAETGAKLIADAGPLAGRSLQYFHIDSWELGQPTWSPRMREEFEQRRGYDPAAWLPALAGWVVDDDAATTRFLQDYRRTAADLVAANYYGRLRELTLQSGLRGTHPESGGPHFTHWIDALQCAGINEVPMGEYWKRNSEPDGIIWHHHNPSLKQAASAAHIYGKPLCQAEAYTSFGCDWADDPWSMKDIGDAAFCEGLTRNVLCFWVHQSRLDARPGFQWQHVGTHFDCNLTWWPLSDAWLTYLARCQYLLRQGRFVADFAYLQSEAIPSFLAPRPEQQPARPPGFDYDVLNAEVLLRRATATAGRLALPDGMSYRYLVLPHGPGALLAPATLQKIRELAGAGVTVIGPPTFADSVPQMRQGPLDAAVRADGLVPDIQFADASPGANFDWIHRREDDHDLYFISNQSAHHAAATVVFRVAGRVPELWDAVTGRIRPLPEGSEDASRTTVPLQFAPRQSWFVVFRQRPPNSKANPVRGGRNFPAVRKLVGLAGPWEVQFDPKWFYPMEGVGAKVRFENLADWTQRPEAAIRYYAGLATYRMVFDCPATPADSTTYLDLGVVKNVARVRLNGRDLGVVWTAPWRVETTGALRARGNELEIEVANLWPNRLIGDALLPERERRTVTNVRTYDTLTGNTHLCKICEERKRTGRPAALLPSGLLGPVTIQCEE